MPTVDELLARARAKREASSILVEASRELLLAWDQERVGRRAEELLREAANLEAEAAALC